MLACKRVEANALTLPSPIGIGEGVSQVARAEGRRRCFDVGSGGERADAEPHRATRCEGAQAAMHARGTVQSRAGLDSERTIQNGRQFVWLESVERDAHYADAIARLTADRRFAVP